MIEGNRRRSRREWGPPASADYRTAGRRASPRNRGAAVNQRFLIDFALVAFVAVDRFLLVAAAFLAVRGRRRSARSLAPDAASLRVAPSSCRCSAPITRPRDSADRSSSESSSRDRSRGFFVRSTVLRLAIPSSSFAGRLPSRTRDGARSEPARFRLKIETKRARRKSLAIHGLGRLQQRRLFREPRVVVGLALHAVETAHAVVAETAQL